MSVSIPNASAASSLILPDVKAEITLGKDVLPYFDSLEIKQYHDKFHEFTLVIDHDVLEQPHAYNPEQSRDLVGDSINPNARIHFPSIINKIF